MKVFTYIAIICTLSFHSAKSQEMLNVKNKNLKYTSDIAVRGKTIDSVFFNSPRTSQRLFLPVPIIASVYTDVASIANKYNLTGYGATFEMILHPTNEYTYINFVLESTLKKTSWSKMDNMYILEKGDRIDCILSSDSYEFSGKGAEKLNCQNDIYKMQYDYKLDSNEQVLEKEKKYIELLQSQDNKRDSILKLQLKTVEKYAPKIGKKLTEIMIANCYGLRYYNPLLLQYQTAISRFSVFKNFIQSQNYKNLNLSIKEKISEEALIASPTYANAVFIKLMLDNSLGKNKELLNSTSQEMTDRIYNDITIKYKGLLREKLIILFFYKFKNKIAMDYINTALSTYITHQEYKNALLAIREIRAEGMPFFQFELEDMNGNLVKLSDFNKDVVILDFWFTGCSGCSKLYKGMKPIFEEYKNHPNVKFISISIDSDKNQWKQSVLSEIYTDSNHINLFTGGFSSNHPVIIKNQIQSYPKLFILNRGKIFSSNPPYPFIGNDEARMNFTKIIKQAINSLSGISM